jgi:hypothetical protein
MESGDGVSQEALLSYVHRVATAHTLPVLKLLQSEVIGLTEMKVARFASGFAKRYSKTVNGFGKYAEQMSKAMQELTLGEALRSGTCLAWRGLFDPKGTGLLSPVPRWCPNCLEASRSSGRSVVHRLIWSIYPVTHCPVHATPLRSNCRSCGSEQHFISEAVPLGRCCICGAFLGYREGLWECSPPNDRERFMTDAVAEMISQGAAASELVQLSRFTDQIKAVAAATRGRGVRQLEREIGFRRHSICRWTEEGKRPQFDQFLELCYRLGIKPVALLDGSWSRAKEPIALRKEDTPIRRQHYVLSESALAALKDDVARVVGSADSFEDAIQVAKRHGITVSSFKHRYGELYALLADHRVRVRASLRETRLARQHTQAVEIVRALHANGTRLTRGRIEATMLRSGMTLKDPLTRAIAFEERARLEALGGKRQSDC